MSRDFYQLVLLPINLYDPAIASRCYTLSFGDFLIKLLFRIILSIKIPELRTIWMFYDRIKLTQLNQEIEHLEKKIEEIKKEMPE